MKPALWERPIFQLLFVAACVSIYSFGLEQGFSNGTLDPSWGPRSGSLEQMTYSSFRTKITPLYKKLNLLKLDDICSLELGKIMHKFHSGNLLDNFNYLFTPVNQVHCHATRSATRGAYFWQMAHTKYGKRSLRHLGPKIWDKIDPSLHDSS